MPAKLRSIRLKKRKIYPGEPEGLWRRLVWHFHRKRKKIARLSVHEGLVHLASTADFGLVTHLKLKIFSKDVQSMLLVAHADVATNSLTIAPTSVSTVGPACAPGVPPQRIETLMPAVQAHVFDSAVAATESTAIMANGRIGVPKFYVGHEQAVISDQNHLLWHGRDGQCLVMQSAIRSQGSGIMLFASGSTNWYHWLFENLPAAFLTEGMPDELRDLPLVIPAEIAGMASFRDSLELFRSGREVVPLGPGLHRFERLVMVDSLVREPMNLRNGAWPVATDYAFSCETLRQFRSAIMGRLGIGATAQTKRVFLARGNNRRTFNQSELLAIAERHGFSVAFPERLSFREQVELLASAAVVIGPSGAAFANTLFCQPGTRLLSWLPPQYSGFCSYTNVATVTKSSLRYLFTTPDRPLKGTHDAFRAGYAVDINAFEAAVRLALESPEY